MPHNSFEVPDIERRASERAARTRELRAKEDAQGQTYKLVLEPKQSEFLELMATAAFVGVKELCKQVGIRQTTFDKWRSTSEDFRKALNIHYNRNLLATNMSRKKVMEGLLESIEMAKDQRQPNSMITGWKEIGRMCGFYEPERREITLSVNSKEILEELTTLSKDKLLEMAADQDAIEGELVLVPPD